VIHVTAKRVIHVLGKRVTGLTHFSNLNNRSIMSIKKHLQDNKEVYIAGATGLLIGGIAIVLCKRYPLALENSSISVKPIAFLARQNVVTVIEANRQGSPSWVVRCKETGQIFMSQKSAAEAMGLPASDISRHLNGVLDHARGYTFERICMAA
jgi:hypothetical protein